MKRLTTPISEAAIRDLKVGDEVLLNGRVVLSRDIGHKYMVEKKPDWLKPILAEAVIYHCGPVVAKQQDGTWTFVSAGPTTSIREEPYQGDVMRHFNLKGVIGKGGMAGKTLQACQEVPAVYLHAIGGAASLIAQSVQQVLGVHKYDFGVPEAIWVIQVKDFPAVVTMDAHGNSLHDTVRQQSKAVLERLLA